MTFLVHFESGVRLPGVPIPVLVLECKMIRYKSFLLKRSRPCVSYNFF